MSIDYQPSDRTVLERNLASVLARMPILSGMGDRYEDAARRCLSLLREVASYRELTKAERAALVHYETFYEEEDA